MSTYCVCVYMPATEEGILHVMGVLPTQYRPLTLSKPSEDPSLQAQEMDRKEMSHGNLKVWQGSRFQLSKLASKLLFGEFSPHWFSCVSPIWAFLGENWAWTIEQALSSNAGFSNHPGLERVSQRHCPLSTQPRLFQKKRLDISTLSFSSSCFRPLTLLLVIKISPGVKPEGSWIAMV